MRALSKPRTYLIRELCRCCLLCVQNMINFSLYSLICDDSFAHSSSFSHFLLPRCSLMHPLSRRKPLIFPTKSVISGPERLGELHPLTSHFVGLPLETVFISQAPHTWIVCHLPWSSHSSCPTVVSKLQMDRLNGGQKANVNFCVHVERCI